MSFANSTARTRGGSAAAAVPARARKTAVAHRSAKKPRKTSIFECKNSIRVKLSLLSAEKAFVCLPRRQTDREDPASRRPHSPRARLGCPRSSPRGGPDGRPRRAGRLGERLGAGAGAEGVQPRRTALEGVGRGLVSDVGFSRPLECLAQGCCRA